MVAKVSGADSLFLSELLKDGEKRSVVGLSNMTKQASPPVKEFQVGTIQASIWRNELKQDGGAVVRYSVKIEKRYRRRQTDEWTSTDQYFPDDLPRLQLVVAKAFEYVSLKSSSQAPQRRTTER